jgi:hypothetical protein
MLRTSFTESGTPVGSMRIFHNYQYCRDLCVREANLPHALVTHPERTKQVVDCLVMFL